MKIKKLRFLLEKTEYLVHVTGGTLTGNNDWNCESIRSVALRISLSGFYSRRRLAHSFSVSATLSVKRG